MGKEEENGYCLLFIHKCKNKIRDLAVLYEFQMVYSLIKYSFVRLPYPRKEK